MFHSHYVRQMAISVAEAAWASGPRPRPPWPSAYCLVLGGLDADRQSGSEAVTSEAFVLCYCYCWMNLLIRARKKQKRYCLMMRDI